MQYTSKRVSIYLASFNLKQPLVVPSVTIVAHQSFMKTPQTTSSVTLCHYCGSPELYEDPLNNL